VTPSGTKIAHRRADLAVYAGVAADEAARVLERLAGEMRILRPVGEESYEIYHDALAAPVLDWRARVHLRELEREQRLRRRWRSLASALAAVAIGLGASAGDFLARQELGTIDLRFAVRGDRSPPDDVVVVAIDDRTFNELGEQWPFPRSIHGRVLDRLRAAGGRAVGYDLQFTEPTQPAEDNALIEAVEGLRGRIALATTEVDDRGESRIFGGDAFLRKIGARAGNAVVLADEDGVTRRTMFAVDGLEAFGLVVAELATGRELERSDVERALIDFAGGPGTMTTLSLSAVERGSIDPALVRGKVAVVGPAAPSLQDIHMTSVGGEMSGAELQANVVKTALDGFPLRTAPAYIGVVTIVVLGLLAVLASRLRALRAFGAALAVGALYAAIAQVAFDAGTVLLVVYPLLTLALAAGLALMAELAWRR
jgi:adenylate cyclase